MEYYVNPNSGSETNAGTADAPWKDLETVLSTGRRFQKSDTIILFSGDHGVVSINAQNGEGATICAAPRQKPVVRSISVSDVDGWAITGLTVTPGEFHARTRRAALVEISPGASRTRVERCLIYSAHDSSIWTANDWNMRARDGIAIAGTDCLVRSNHLLNVNFGLLVSGANNIVERNLIENFCGDGVRGLGSSNMFQGNLIKNSYKVNANHADGFQSWTRGATGVGSGTISNVVLKGNVILNYENANQPFRAALQGIGCFDGFYDGWLIENNLIIVDNHHGITLAGARNCRILNNTVIDINGTRPGPPWIKIANHKSGAMSEGNLVRNNLAFAFNIRAGSSTSDHNVLIMKPELTFLNFPFDLRLRPGSTAIDAGSAFEVPGLDITGARRPVASGPRKAKWDAGAFEFNPADKSKPKMSFSEYLLPW